MSWQLCILEIVKVCICKNSPCLDQARGKVDKNVNRYII